MSAASQHGQPPPPGWQPAGGPALPGYFAPGGLPVAAHKPGAVPLRPLQLSDIFDAAFKVVRFNPQATVGAAALVSVLASIVPVAVNLATLASSTPNNSQDPFSGDFGTLQALAVSYLAGLIGHSIGNALLTGMVVHVVLAACIGRKLSLAEAWSATQGRRWRLLGLTLVISLAQILMIAAVIGFWVLLIATSPSAGLVIAMLAITVPITTAVMALFYVRVGYLAVPAMMLENIGVFAAMGRALTLSKRQFWRILGIALLTYLVAAIVAYFAGLPFRLAGAVVGINASPDAGRFLIISVLIGTLSSAIGSMISTPFTSAVTGLQYVDQRMRKESFDIELMRRAGILSG